MKNNTEPHFYYLGSEEFTTTRNISDCFNIHHVGLIASINNLVSSDKKYNEHFKPSSYLTHKGSERIFYHVTRQGFKVLESTIA